MKFPEKKCLSYLAGAGLISLSLGLESANALDIRSWDRDIKKAERRFIVLSTLNNEAVLDKETQMVWERTPDNSSKDWYGARNACVRKEVDGKAGWRLPSIQELSSLVDATQNDPAIKSGHPFLSVNSRAYWSGTKAAMVTSVSSPSDSDQAGATGAADVSELKEAAWNLDFGTSGAVTFSTPDAINLNTLSANKLTWCVRGPSASQSE